MSKFTPIFCVLLSTVSHAFTWPEATPEQVGLDPEYIESAIEMIESGDVGQIRSLIIIKDGYLVTEKYFSNQGEKRPVYSVTKSIGSALLGIAKYQGADINLNDPMMSYLPQYNDIPNILQVQAVTLHDLLAQRHGYNWDEWIVPYGNPNNPVSQMLRQFDWYRFALQWPIFQAPDQFFAYSTGHSSLMSPILENRTGRDVYEFATNELFEPLGITDTHWELIDGGGTQGQGIASFPYGTEPLGFGLWLKPIDMAKVGELYRLNGVWGGTRILSSEWVEKSVQRYSDGNSDSSVFSDEFSGYGYQWWSLRFVDRLNQTTDTYYADGYGRQFIMVMPELNATIVSTADDYGVRGPGIGTVLREHLLLAFDRGEQSAINITHDLNGSWYWPENTGQGIDFQILNEGNTIAGYWYTYEQEGGAQRWFAFQGDVNSDLATFNIYSTAGGGFVVGETPEIAVWGVGSLLAYDCFSGLFRYESSSEGVSGEIPLTRLSASTGACLENTKKNSKKKNNRYGYIP